LLLLHSNNNSYKRGFLIILMTKEKTFHNLGISDDLVAVLEKCKITVPTEIQEKAIPWVMKGKDIVANSATGSGKTLAFATTIIENVKPGQGAQALILTPTRELAEQIASSIRKFAVRKMAVFACYGGVKIEEHVKKIPKADVIISTPGRLVDLLSRQAVDLSSVKTFVLDEFDRMLDMGFTKDVEIITRKVPEKRQTMLFSATTNAYLEDLIKQYVKFPKEIKVKSHVDHSKLEQIYYPMKRASKFSLLVHLLSEERAESVMVFCSTQLNTDYVAENLERRGFDVKVIHGGIDQKKRINRLNKFHKEGGVLVCTDVAARGLDIKNVTHVYNYDLPRVPEDYIHRIGRTARAGKEGKAITLLSTQDEPVFNDIMNLDNIKVTEMDLPVVDKLAEFKPIQKNKGDTSNAKRRGMKWVCIDDPDLSNRERKRSVGRKLYDDDDEIPGVKKRKRYLSKAEKGKRNAELKKKAMKGSKRAQSMIKKRGRAGNRTGKVKKNNRAKGRSNRHSKR